MNLLLWTEICEELPTPDFGAAFAMHIEHKRNPAVRRASLAAWNLLARGLTLLRNESCANSIPLTAGNTLPKVRFGALGKPDFVDSPLHFSLAHSGKLAAALISSAPCGVDVERIRPELANHLRARCLSPEELRLGLDFFECWTKKECIGKRTGEGIDAHPAQLDTLDARWAGQFFSDILTDSTGQTYVLAALCEDVDSLRVTRA